jgi:preprotein translocase subunit YajC
VSLEWDQSLLEGDRVTLSGGQVFEITDTTAEESWLTAKRGQATRIE